MDLSTKEMLEYYYKKLQLLREIKFKNGDNIDDIKQCVKKIEIIKASIESYRRAKSRRIASKIKRIFNEK